jgi:nucleotide-binding universal stress UspA family protein
MKSIFIPVDFSVPSVHAVDYAADLANDRGFEQVILVANCLASPIFDSRASKIENWEGRREMRKTMSQLNMQLLNLKARLEKKLHPNIIINARLRQCFSISSICKLARKGTVDLVLIGSNSSESGTDSILGNQIINICKTISVPVMIVPPVGNYKTITHAVVSFEQHSSTEVFYLNRINQLQKSKNPMLIDREDPEYRPEAVDPESSNYTLLNSILKDFKYYIYEKEANDRDIGLTTFADSYYSQLIIKMPGNSNLFYNLTNKDISEPFILNGHIPVLVLI